MSYDPACLELARHFALDEDAWMDDELTRALAEAISDAVDDWLEEYRPPCHCELDDASHCLRHRAPQPEGEWTP